MAVISSGIWPIDPTVTSGSELAAFLNEFVDAFESGQASPSRPSVLNVAVHGLRPWEIQMWLL